MSRHHGWCQVFYNERLKVLAWVSSERLDFCIASMAQMQDLYYYVLFATFSNMTKAYLFASHVLLFVILKPSDVPTLYVNLCQFTSSCISPSVVLSQLLAIGLCQWHHQRCQDLGRQSLKCWSRSCQHLMKTCSCLLQGLPSFLATQGVWTFIQGWCCTVPRVTKAVTGAIKAGKLQED